MRRLTDKQGRYAGYRLYGYPPLVSARLAGYSDNGGSGIRVCAYRLERHEGIKVAVRNMKDAACYEALKRIRRGLPVSQGVLALLAEWPGASPRVRERMRVRLTEAVLDQAKAALDLAGI